MPQQNAPSPPPTTSARCGLLVLGNQLFAPAHLPPGQTYDVFMREDVELCTYFRFHQQKLAFFLGAMRHHAAALRKAGHDVTYQELDDGSAPYEAHLTAWLKARKLTRLLAFEIEDHFFAERIAELTRALGIAFDVLPSPMFLTDRPTFQGYLTRSKRPFMHTFYQAQRKRLGVLVNGVGDPRGGKWSFDADNREPLAPHVAVPDTPPARATPIDAAVAKLVAARFGNHPGKADASWLPTHRAGAIAWLKRFLHERLPLFGPYEDALTQRSDVVFHGVLTPFLNVGLLTPREVLDQALAVAAQAQVPLQSLEGFVRQIIGWREFIRGIYHNFDHLQQRRNHFDHRRRLADVWYGQATGIPPLDDVLGKVLRLGWAHHIERLMVLGSMMLLCEVHPHEAHRWFMEMFVDSSDWVMGPNVYGMALFSDGGIFATKPYFCGSNYYRKMGGYKKGPWCDGVDGLYWQFVAKHRDALGRNMRMFQVVRNLDRLAAARKETIFRAGDALRERLTLPPAPQPEAA